MSPLLLSRSPIPLGPYASVIDLNRAGAVLRWHWFLISVPNLVVIAAMVAVFALAIALPFPRGSRHHDRDGKEAR